MIFYHVDRIKLLKDGDVIDFKKVPENCNKEIEEYCCCHYSNKLSNIGLIYTAYSNPQDPFYPNYVAEIILEKYRQLKHPNLPSRFQSLCCTDSLDGAKFWINELKIEEANIIQVSSNTFAKCDASWRDIISSNLSICSVDIFAENYWTGKPFEYGPRPEFLVPLPLRVIKIVDFFIR